MNLVSVVYLSSDRKSEVEKLDINNWLKLSMDGSKQELLIPITDRKPAMRAACWVESKPDLEHRKGLHSWKPLNVAFCDDNGIGYIHSTFKATKAMPFPTPEHGWALLKVRNGEYFLDKPHQQYLAESDVDESVEEWNKKMDYVDALAGHGISLLIFSGVPDRKTDITPYLRQMIDAMGKPAAERAVEKRHRIVGKQIRKSIYQITQATKPAAQPEPVELETDEEPEYQPITFRAVTKAGKAVIIDLKKVDGMAKFDLLEDGNLVTGYQILWTNDPNPKLDGPRENVMKYSKNPRFQLRGDIQKDWIVREEVV